jgi:hypothetical protein
MASLRCNVKWTGRSVCTSTTMAAISIAMVLTAVAFVSPNFPLAVESEDRGVIETATLENGVMIIQHK